MNDSSNSDLQILQFLVQNVRFCVDLQFVNKVLPLTQVEVVPDGPTYLVGLFNLASKSIPIFDLGIRLNLYRDTSYSLDTPIVLCSDDQHQAGMVVDKILGLATVAGEALQMREEFNKDGSPFLAAVTINSELSLLINMSYLLRISLTAEGNRLTVGRDLINMATITDE